MGLDATTTQAIWAVAVVAILVGAGKAAFEVAEEMEEAREAREARTALRLQTRLAEATFCHDADAQELRVTATSRTNAPLRLDLLTFLVDGAVATGFVEDGGSGSDLWLPDETRTFTRAGTATEPGRVALVTAAGVVAHAEKVPCRLPTTIVVTPASASLLTGDAQPFTATAYDDLGQPMSGFTFTWSATLGSVDAGGLYAATQAGAGTVTASVGGVSGSADVTVTRNVHVEAMGTYLNGAPATTFLKRDTVEARATLHDHQGLVVQGATVRVEFVDPNGLVQSQQDVATDASGVASASYLIPSSAAQGSWTARVASVSGADLAYDSASNVVSQAGFTVSSN